MPGIILEDEIHRAFLIARAAVTNAREYLDSRNQLALRAVQGYEIDLDALDRKIDKSLPLAITGVSEKRARELLAYHQFISDLERIGDLVLWAANHLPASVTRTDKYVLLEMLNLIAHMLEEVYLGFRDRSTGHAGTVFSSDTELDMLRSQFFRVHLKRRSHASVEDRVALLLIAQALERAGDHCTNLAEEVIHLVEHRSVRHVPKKQNNAP